MFDCSLRSRGSRFEAAAFLTHSQTKSVSARSFVQDSGARSWPRGVRLRSQLGARVDVTSDLGQTDFGVDVSERGAGDLTRPVSALGENRFELAALLHELEGPIPVRRRERR